MRSPLTTVVLASLISVTLWACTEHEFTYRHAVLEDADGLSVIERSTSSLDTQGRELQSPILGLPIRSELRRPTYVVEFHTSLQSSPLLFMAATSSAGEQLVVAGPHIHRVAQGSAEELEGHFYSFYFKEADSPFIAFSVSDARGNTLGAERLRYSLVPRGRQTEGDLSVLDLRGSNRQFQHLVRPGTVTVGGKLGLDIPPGTLNSILKSSGLKKVLRTDHGISRCD